MIHVFDTIQSNPQSSNVIIVNSKSVAKMSISKMSVAVAKMFLQSTSKNTLRSSKKQIGIVLSSNLFPPIEDRLCSSACLIIMFESF